MCLSPLFTHVFHDEVHKRDQDRRDKKQEAQGIKVFVRVNQVPLSKKIVE